MQKKLYIIAAGVLLLAGCAQFGNKNDASVNASSATKTAPVNSAAPTATDNSSSIVNTNVKASANVPSADDETAKVVAAMGAPETKAQEVSAVAAVVDNNQPTTYKVEIGDSLYSIARKNNISMTCLAKANKITDPNRLAAGQTLVIPNPADC